MDGPTSGGGDGASRKSGRSVSDWSLDYPSEFVKPNDSWTGVEVIVNLTSYLSRDCAIALSQTCRNLNLLCEGRIWRELVLAPPAHYGERPLVIPTVDSESELDTDWEDAMMEEAEERRSAALRAGLKANFCCVPDRRWRMVRSIRMTPSPGTTQHMMRILDACATNIEMLVIDELEDRSVVNLRPGRVRSPKFESYITFSNLTHLRWDHISTCHMELWHLIRFSAPNLESLALDFDFYEYQNDAEAYDDDPPGFPPFERSTMIKRLRLSFGSSSPSEHGHPAYGTLLALIKASPRLTELGLGGDIWNVAGSYGGGNPLEELLHTLSDHQSLRDLSWPGNEIDWCGPGGEPGFVNLRRLVFQSDHIGLNSSWVSHQCICILDVEADAQDIYPMAGLTELYMDCAAATKPSSRIPKSPSGLAFEFRYYSNLCRKYATEDAIDKAEIGFGSRLDEISRGPPNVSATSICHRNLDLYNSIAESDEEIILMLILQPDVAETDEDTSVSSTTHPHSGIATAPYLSYIDFDGKSVPVQIIERMKEIEGAVVDWGTRGARVGDVAWQVILDWREQIRGEETPESGDSSD